MDRRQPFHLKKIYKTHINAVLEGNFQNLKILGSPIVNWGPCPRVITMPFLEESKIPLKGSNGSFWDTLQKLKLAFIVILIARRAMRMTNLDFLRT